MVEEGSVVLLCSTGQAGTIISVSNENAFVLLRNGDIWVGPTNQLRLPQSTEELEFAPIDVERPAPKRKKKNHDFEV